MRDQLRSIIERLYGHAFGEGRRQLLQTRFHIADDGVRICSTQGQHDAFDSFAFAILRHSAIAGKAADAGACDIADADHHIVAGRKDDARNILRRLDGANRSHDERFFANTDAAGAVIAVGGLDRGREIGHRQAGGSEGDGIW